MNLGRYVRRTAEHHPDAEAVVCGHVRLTYAELDDHSDRLAAALTGLGLSRGERVATLAANRAELVVTEVALYKAGLTRAPVNARLGDGEVAHLLRESDARVLLTDAAHLDTARRAVPGSGVKAVIGYDGPADLGPGYQELLAATPARPSTWSAPRTTSPSCTSPPAPPASSRQPCRRTAIGWPCCASR